MEPMNRGQNYGAKSELEPSLADVLYGRKVRGRQDRPSEYRSDKSAAEIRCELQRPLA